MKKILFLASNFPKPLDSGGKIRDYYIIERIARRHEVWVAGFQDSDLKAADAMLPFVPAE